MKSGYGRGYYGAGQLASSAPRQRSWFKIVAFVGVGAAAVWLLWPRGSLPAGVAGGPEAAPPLPPALPPASPDIAVLPATAATAVTALASANNAPSTVTEVAMGAFQKQVEDDARARGYVSPADYENAVITTARQLQETGAKVVLAPHLQHLTRRIGS
jgi:hypothetical protein